VDILERYPPDGDLARVVSQQAWLALFHGDPQTAVELADEAIRLAEAAGDEPTVIDTLNTKGVALADQGDPGWLAPLEDSRSRAERRGHAAEEFRALANTAAKAADLLDLDWLEDLAQRSLTVAVRHEIPANEAWARILLGWVDVYRGRWEAAYDAVSEALTSFRDPDDPHRHLQAVTHELNVVAALATLQARMGRPEAGPNLGRAWELVGLAPWPQSYRRAGLATAEYLWLTGDHDPDLVAALQETLASAPITIGFDPGFLAFWLWELGHLEEVPDGIAEPHRVLMGGRPAEAAALWEARGYPHQQALALMHGDEDHQLQALRILDELGAAATADKLRRMLHEAGVQIPRGQAVATRRHPAGLTARQAEVLDLLADDLTNTEIADRLFISTRTAENHVAAILTKLGVASRQDAVTQTRRFGLLAGSRSA
jgi:DNA-binding CsgD family transcriptional regulator